MLLSRYNYIRDRLIELYNIVNNREYYVWIAPETMMSLDQLRSMEFFSQENFVDDSHYYETPLKRKFRIPMILPFLENIQSENDITFDRASTTIVEIYESIQEYISLWSEVLREVPEIPPTDLNSLKPLENLAFILFDRYKAIKPYQRWKEEQKYSANREMQERYGLAGLASLFSHYRYGVVNDNEDITFISHIDLYNQAGGQIGGIMYEQAGFAAPVSSDPIDIYEQGYQFQGGIR